jgi:hypothetical protein
VDAARDGIRNRDAGIRAEQGAPEPEREEGARPCRRKCR